MSSTSQSNSAALINHNSSDEGVTATAASCNRSKIQSIIELNNLGVEFIEAEDDEEAEFQFQQSLEQACVEMNSTLPLQNSNLSTSTSSPTTNSTTGEYLYDEGVHIYTEPITIDDNNDVSVDLCAVVATTLYNKGLISIRQDTFKEARKNFLNALYHILRSSSNNNTKSNTSSCCVTAVQVLHNIGFVQYKLGCLQDALNAFTEAFQILTKFKNITHDTRDMLDLAATLNCLGVVYSHLPGNFNKAVEVYSQSLGISREIMVARGENHRGADQQEATILNNLGRVHFKNGDLNKALPLYREALQIRVTVYGNEHLDVAASTFNIGQTHHQLGHYEQAMGHYQAFIHIVMQLLGEEHYDLANGWKGIAQIHQQQNRFDEAIQFYEKALQLDSNDAEEVAAIYDNLGSACCQKGDLGGAVAAYKESLEIRRDLHGFFHSSIVSTMQNLGHIHKLRGDSQTCVRILETAAQIQRKLHGQFHPSVSSTLSKIALIHYNARKYKQALHFYQEVLQIQREVHGPIHHHPATTLRSIGHLLFYTENYEMALLAFNEFLTIHRSLDNPNSDDIAGVISNIAAIHWNLGDYEKCLMNYSESLAILRNALGCQRHIKLVPILKQIGNICRQRGMFHESIRFFTEAVEIQKMTLPNNNTVVSSADSATTDPSNHNANTNTRAARQQLDLEIAQTLNEIANLQLQRGETDEMMASFSEASRHLCMSGQTEYDLPVSDLNFYDISKMCPECSPAA